MTTGAQRLADRVVELEATVERLTKRVDELETTAAEYWLKSIEVFGKSDSAVTPTVTPASRNVTRKDYEPALSRESDAAVTRDDAPLSKTVPNSVEQPAPTTEPAGPVGIPPSPPPAERLVRKASSGKSAAERAREYRERKKRDQAQAEQQAKADKAEGLAARGHRLPEPWDGPTEDSIDVIRAKHPDLDIDAETEKFCDYWHALSGEKAIKRDWQATWRNWMRRAAGNKPRGRPPGPGLPPNKSDAAVQRILAMGQNPPEGYR